MTVLVGLRVFDLHVQGTRSLKEKRFVLRSVKDRIANGFNVALAETGHQDKWQRAELAIAAVGSGRRSVERTLDAVRELLDSEPGLRVIETTTEIL